MVYSALATAACAQPGIRVLETSHSQLLPIQTMSATVHKSIWWDTPSPCAGACLTALMMILCATRSTPEQQPGTHNHAEPSLFLVFSLFFRFFGHAPLGVRAFALAPYSCAQPTGPVYPNDPKHVTRPLALNVAASSGDPLSDPGPPQLVGALLRALG